MIHREKLYVHAHMCSLTCVPPPTTEAKLQEQDLALPSVK